MRWLAAAVVLVGLAGWAEAHPAVTKPCKDCHADVHRGELAAACGDCHTTERWAPSTFGAAKHTKYRLEGRHAATPCGGCHTGPRPRVSFVILQQDCLDCHANPHGTKFAAEQVKGGCGGCHTAGNWKAWKVDHRAWPLDGAHERVACAACHPGRAADAPAAAYRGVPRACDRCHDDLHAGQFRTAPAKPCTACHRTESFREPFDHAATRYPLDGVHVAMACARCHPTVALRNGEQAVRWRLGFAACGDCHANPHPKVKLDCKACHGATTWRLEGTGAGFDHAATGFALRGAHVATPCSACHANRKRPASTCEGCHRDPHAGRVDGACAECHTATAWADVAILERHRRTRMPLTGKHAVIECSACHKRGEPKSDVPVDCVACHRAGAAAASPDHAAFSRDCARCHVTIAWSPATDPSLLRTGRAYGLRTARRDHDAWFPLSAGSHRTADCAACHVDERRRRIVRCDGCHTAAAMRARHRTPVAAVASACLQCHPRGVRR